MLKIKTKKFSRFLKDVVLTIARPIRALHRVRDYIAAEPGTDLARRVQENGSTFEAFKEKISSTVGNLVNSVVVLWEDHKVLTASCLTLNRAQSNPTSHHHWLWVHSSCPLDLPTTTHSRARKRAKQSALPTSIPDPTSLGSVGGTGGTGGCIYIL